MIVVFEFESCLSLSLSLLYLPFDDPYSIILTLQESTIHSLRVWVLDCVVIRSLGVLSERGKEGARTGNLFLNQSCIERVLRVLRVDQSGSCGF